MKAELMYKLLLACGRSYMNDKTFKQVLEDETEIRVLNDFCHYGKLGEFIVIAVRGSDDAEDWKRNLKADFGGELIGRIESMLMMKGHRFKKIILTAHSRGAPMGLKMASKLSALGFNIEMVVTFASPMVRNPTYSPSAFTHYRFVNGRDGVPSTPLLIQRMFTKGSWGHYGKLIHMNKPSWWFSWAKVSGTIKDHLITSYREAFIKHYGMK